MNNEIIEEKNWWKRNWIWFVSIIGIVLISIVIFFSSGMSGITTDLVQAYTDTELYDNALEKVKADKRAIELLGKIEPIGKMAILEGEVQFSNNNKKVKTTIRLKGTKGKARMDIVANRIDNKWIYEKLNIRIKNPPEKKQTIEIIKTTE